MKDRVLVVGIISCLALLLAAPIAFGRSNAVANTYSLTLAHGTCASPLPLLPLTQKINCDVATPTANSVTPTTNDPTVTNVLYNFIGPVVPPSGISGHGSVKCTTSSNVVTCGSFNFPTTKTGNYRMQLVFVTKSGSSITLEMFSQVSVLVEPQFPLGTLVAALAPISAFGFFIFAKRGGRMSFTRSLSI